MVHNMSMIQVAGISESDWHRHGHGYGVCVLATYPTEKCTTNNSHVSSVPYQTILSLSLSQSQKCVSQTSQSLARRRMGHGHGHGHGKRGLGLVVPLPSLDAAF